MYNIYIYIYIYTEHILWNFWKNSIIRLKWIIFSTARVEPMLRKLSISKLGKILSHGVKRFQHLLNISALRRLRGDVERSVHFQGEITLTWYGKFSTSFRGSDVRKIHFWEPEKSVGMEAFETFKCSSCSIFLFLHGFQFSDLIHWNFILWSFRIEALP